MATIEGGTWTNEVELIGTALRDRKSNEVNREKGNAMLFSLQKLFWYAAVPPGSQILLMILGLFISRLRRKLGAALVAGGILLLNLLSLGPVADLLLKPLP